jgi:adenylate cyclase
MQIRVYSRYPWPGRENGGPQDEFELAAIDWLEANAEPGTRPAAEYSRFVSEGDRRMLLYFTARHMEQSCLGCHNHPDGQSPKKDWQVGDVVGVMKIVRPLDREIENTHRGLGGAFVLMAATSGLLLIISVVLAIVARRRRTSTPHDA